MTDQARAERSLTATPKASVANQRSARRAEEDDEDVTPKGETPARERVLALLKRFGWNATSFQILEPGFHYWFDADDACIGYVDTGRAWVAAPPVAAPERFAAVMDRFIAAATEAGRRVCCFAAEERFVAATGWPALQVGDQPVWQPAAWNGILDHTKSLREQLRRGRAKGVAVREVPAEELVPGHPTRARLDALIVRWLATRPMAPMGFLVQVEPFEFPAERRMFVAEHAGEVVGLLGVIPMYARRGWFFEDFLRDPTAPNGTVELLVDAGMRAAVAAGIEHVTFGMVPLAGDVSPVLRAVRRAGRALYDFDGLRAFKAKFRPTGWDRIYLAYPHGESSILAVLDTLTAFSRGGLLQFGVKTALRGPAIVVRLLAVLLVGWTVMLALPTSAPWFPSPAWQYGWVAFDVVLAVALISLSIRWRPRLAEAVTIAVTCDALLTAVEALAYNAPRSQRALDVCILLIAVMAPTVAAILLWNARAHRLSSSAAPSRS